MKYILPDWPAPKSIHAFTTTRAGWQVTYPFQASAMAGSAESHQLHTLLNLPSEPIWLKQTHSTIVTSADPNHIGVEADASYTSNAKHVCAVVTADCLPILICNTAGTEVAAIHAGWRGLVNGIIENTVNVLLEPHDKLMVWLGPAIGPTVFEVGHDVYSAFTSLDSHAALAFKPHTEGKWLADIYELARMRLYKLGITKIYGGQYCTLTQPELFYSYRGENGQTGRMVSLIWITPSPSSSIDQCETLSNV